MAILLTDPFSNSAVVPANGRFGVYDGSYDPADWPYTGYYAGNEFRVEVFVTNSLATAEEQNPARATARKKIRRRNHNRAGITAYQAGALGTLNMTEEHAFKTYMEGYFFSCYYGARQVDLDYNELDPSITVESLPKLGGSNDWLRLRACVYGTNLGTCITDFHYFGHGNVNGIGEPGLATHIMLGALETSPVLKTNPMSYVFIDGCKSAKNMKMLKAMVGHDKKYTRAEMAAKGLMPSFGAGWKDEANIGYVNQGTLRVKHFDWIMDFYQKLTELNQGDILFRTFQEALDFAAHPNGQGVGGQFVIDNNEGNALATVGCKDCYFDELGL
jgi:hypothetical protein